MNDMATAPSLDSFIASISDSRVRILARNDVRSLSYHNDNYQH